MSRERRIAWAARHFTATRNDAIRFRDLGMVEAARTWAGYARQDWADLQRLLGSESATGEVRP